MSDIHQKARALDAAKAASEAQQLDKNLDQAIDVFAVENGGLEAVLPFIKMGRRAQRSGWNGKGMYVYMVVPHDEGYLPYLMMSTAQGNLVPWLASQTDLLAHDWRLLGSDEIGKAGE